jgi:hypothetical protein
MVAASVIESTKPVQILIMAFKVNPMNEQPHEGDQGGAN